MDVLDLAAVHIDPHLAVGDVDDFERGREPPVRLPRDPDLGDVAVQLQNVVAVRFAEPVVVDVTGVGSD